MPYHFSSIVFGGGGGGGGDVVAVVASVARHGHGGCVWYVEANRFRNGYVYNTNSIPKYWKKDNEGKRKNVYVGNKHNELRGYRA